MTTIVLAGGRSTRLGRDKLSVDVGGRCLLLRVLDTVVPLSSEVLVVLAPGGHPPVPFWDPKVRWIEDSRPERSSLVGVYTGLQAAADYRSLVVAGDMPFLQEGLLRYMTDLAPGFDVVIPRVGAHLEPLHAIYSKDCLPHIEGLLGQGDLRIYEFLPRVRVRYVSDSEIDVFDSRRLCFFNINTESDLERARSLATEVKA